MGMKKYKQIDDKVELCIPPELEPELKKIFEKEMQHGFRGILADGTMHDVFAVSEEKAFLLRKFSGIFSYDGTILGN